MFARRARTMSRCDPVVLLLLIHVALTGGQYEGDICVKNGARGTCIVLDKCQSAIMNLMKGIPPQVCSYKGMDPVVCCPDKVVTSPVSTARPPVLTTTMKGPTTTTEYVPPFEEYTYNDPNEKKGECEPIAANLTSPRTGQKAWDKCIEYQERLVYPCTKGNTLSGEKARVYRCNHNTDSLIVGGISAALKEFPHMALLGFGTDVNAIQWLCGGSIISERYILTAGHCTYSREAGAVTYALVGILSRTERVDVSQRYKIKTIIKHPNYKPPKRYNDIALLETETDIILSDKVVPACLHVDTAEPDNRALASGWGATQNRGVSADVLQKVILNKFTVPECAALFPPMRLMKEGFDSKTQICYGDKDKSKDTCQGDSGGPLQLKSQRIHCMYTVVGVTSFGRACGIVGEPGIYTKVASYVPWIESIVWP